MKLRQATHAVFTVGVACLFLYGERWKIKMDLQYATTTTGGVLSAREAFKNPELVLNHITEEGATFSVSLLNGTLMHYQNKKQIPILISLFP